MFWFYLCKINLNHCNYYKKDNFLYIKNYKTSHCMKIFFPINFCIYKSFLYLNLEKKMVSSLKLKKLKTYLLSIFIQLLSNNSFSIETKGIGLRPKINGNFLVLKLGYTHLCCVFLPSEFFISISKIKIILKYKLLIETKLFVALLLYLKYPDSYKGCGLKLQGKEYITKIGKRE